MFAVPFENLDIGLGRPILCDEARFLHKVIVERRGGFCYELNGAFAALLRAIGFDVTLLSARVGRADGTEGPDFDHMALLVRLEESWLADVGFGDSFIEPLLMEPGLEQAQTRRQYRIIADGERFRYQMFSEGHWKSQYSFTIEPRRLSEFAELMQVTKSAVSQLVTQLERDGLLERVPDPTDGRAALIRATPRADLGFQVARALLADIEREWESLIGLEQLDELSETLGQLEDWTRTRRPDGDAT